MSEVQPVQVGKYTAGGGSPLLWVCGPCVIETHDLTLRIAETLRRIADDLGVSLVFKASFDKANRTSGKSFRGVGLGLGLKILDAARRATGLPVTTDIHEAHQAAPAAEVHPPTNLSRRVGPGKRSTSCLNDVGNTDQGRT